MHPLEAISPIDGRYRNKVENLAQYFSEYALIRYRILVEIEYFLALVNIDLPELKAFDTKNADELRKVYLDFTPEEAKRVKEIEGITNHDVKAVEYYLKEVFKEKGLEKFSEFIHFGLTSQDVNNTATPLLLKEFIDRGYLPLLEKLLKVLNELIDKWSNIPMLARTHGQPASPTLLGKEIKVFHERILQQLALLNQVPFSAKFGGATGNFNAHHVSYPDIDWVSFGNTFVNETLGLSRSQTTTQIDHYDHLAAIFDCLKRINTILIDFCRDIWTYISMDYFKQKIKEGEVGSSAMPHKVNPIDFENAEGNLGIANAIFGHLSSKLPVSRLQRDLTDSTVLRNLGVPAAHTIISLKSIMKGIGKLLVNEEKMKTDLENNWTVVAEAIQTILRKEGYPNPFEALKLLTRTNKRIDARVISEFIDQLNISVELKKRLKKITPFNYTGVKLV